MPTEQEPYQPSEKEELITLPDEEEMLRRLKAINDASPLVEKFYPLLLEEAGQQKTGQGLKLMVELAIYDYVKDLPPVMASLMGVHEQDIIEALAKPSKGDIEQDTPSE